jgi:hypothetical protein
VSRQLDASFLPLPLRGVPTAVIADREGTAAAAPVMSPTLAETVCQHLLHAAARLRAMPVDRIAAAIDGAARQLRRADEPERATVAAGLIAFAGCSTAMAVHVLDRVSQDWLEPALQELLRAELGGGAAIEGFVERGAGRSARAVAPPLGFHVFAGNVPGVSVTSIVRALLVRSAVFGKSAAGEPILAPAFARLLARTDAEVGACVAVSYWPGGDAAIEAAIMRHAGLVVHYGGDEAIASLRARAAADTIFVEHGPRISFAVVDARALDSDACAAAAADLARAIALFDQQGCVSPQAAYVIGSADNARAFADLAARQLSAIAHELPRGRLEAGEAAAIRDVRTRAEFRAIRGEDVELWAGDDMAWTVVLDADAAFGGSCLNRTIVIRRVRGVDELLDAVRPFGRFLQTVGVAGFPDDCLADLAARLADAGATRVAPIRAMPWPPVTWHHDGRGPLRELVRWTDLER